MQWLRIIYVVFWETAVGILAIIWVTAGKDIFALVDTGGKHAGPFTDAITNMDQLMPALIGVLALAGVVYLVVGGIQDERRVRRPRP